MKTNLPLLTACGFALATSLAFAAPVTQTTAVHTKADSSAATITYLKAGTEPVAAPSALANTPAGWMAIELPGPFQGYVEKKDMTKGLDVKPGTPIRLSPAATAGVLTVAERGDKTSLTGLQGKWAQVSVEKPIIGYIEVGGMPGYTPAIATTPATSAAGTGALTSPLPPTPIDVAPVASSTAPGQPVAMTFLEGSGSLPRQFAGKFTSTRSLLHPRRPYDWQLVDNAGQRFAYLDVSKLLLTEQIDKYTGHFVVVFGATRPTTDGKAIVITVESLQLQLR